MAKQVEAEFDSLFYWQTIINKFQDPLYLLTAFNDDEKKQVMRRIENEILVQELQKKKDQQQSLTTELSSLFFNAIQGSEKAQHLLGQYYINNKNYIEAVKWLELAASQGNSFAAINMGEYYSEVVKDINLGIYWYEKASEHGNAIGMNNLAMIYARNPDKYELAIQIYMKALDNANNNTPYYDISKTQYNLAILYRRLNDKPMSLYWMTQSANNGLQVAKDYFKSTSD